MNSQAEEEMSLRERAREGDVSAMLSYAKRVEQRDASTAFGFVRQAASHGDSPIACARLGKMYSRGVGCEESQEAAAFWFKQACQQGSLEGKELYGMCIVTGTGVKQNPEEGLRLLKECAEQGSTSAMKHLGWIYKHGAGVPMDKAESRRWYHSAKQAKSMAMSRASVTVPKSVSGTVEGQNVVVSERRAADSRSGGSHSEKRREKPKTRSTEKSNSADRPGYIPVEPLPAYAQADVPRATADPVIGTVANEPTENNISAELRGPQELSKDHTARKLRANFGRDRHSRSSVPSVAQQEAKLSRQVDVNLENAPERPGYRQEGHNLRIPQGDELELARQHDIDSSGSREFLSPPTGATSPPLGSHSEEYARLPMKRSQLEQQREAAHDGKSWIDGAAGSLAPTFPTDSSRVSEFQSGRVNRVVAAGSAVEETVHSQHSGSSTRARISTSAGTSHDRSTVLGGRPPSNGDAGHGKMVVDAHADGSTAFGVGRAAVKPHKDRYSATPQHDSAENTDRAGVAENPSFSSALRTFRDGDNGLQRSNIDRRESERLRRNDSMAPSMVPASPVTPAPDDIDVLPFEQVEEVQAGPQDSLGESLSAPVPVRSDKIDLATAEASRDEVYAPASTGNRVLHHSSASPRAHSPVVSFSTAAEQAAETAVTSNVANGGVADEQSMPRTVDDVQHGRSSRLNRRTLSQSDYLERARKLTMKYPPRSSQVQSTNEMYDCLNEIQEIAWKNQTAGKYLIDQDWLGMTCRAMLSFPRSAGIQERGIHCLTRLIRAAETGHRESLVLDNMTFDKALNEGHTSQGRPGEAFDRVSRVTSSSPSRRLKTDLVMTVIKSMRGHPEVMTIQLAGCNVLAEFMSISHAIREHTVTSRGHAAIVDALRVRGRAASFDLVYLVHEMACRALSELCRSSNSDAFKEAVGDASGVEQVISSVGRWTVMERMPDEFRTSVTRHGCATLRHLTHHCERNAWKGISSNGLLVLVRVLETHNEHAAVCLSAIAAMTSIAVVSNDSAKKELEDSDGLPCIMGAIRRHSDNPVLVRKGLQCLRMFVSFGSQSRRRVIEGNAIDTTLIVMRKYPDDSRIQEQGCGALALICRDEAVAKGVVANSGGVECVTRALNTHQKEINIAEYGSLAISSMCSHHEGNQESARQVDTPSSIVSCMKIHGMRHTSAAVMTSSAVRVLALSTILELSERFLSLGAPDLLLNVMKVHKEVPKVQEHACFALSALCARNDSLPKRIVRSGAVDILLDSLNRYVSLSPVVYAVVCAIRSMVSKSREVVLQFIVSRLPASLQKALSHHMSSLPQNDNVVIVICATLNVCAFKFVAHKNEIGAAGIIEQMRELISISSEKQDEAVLHPALSTLCTLLVNSPDNQDRFQEVGGVEAVLEILALWRKNEGIVELCCVVLRHSCGEHDGNRDDIKAKNGIRTLQGALHNHPSSPAVITAACQALAVICYGDSELQTSAGMLDSIPSTVEAMEMFQDNSSVQAGACSFLFAVTQNNPRNKKRTVRCGGRSAIVRALELHPGNAEVNNYGAHALLEVQNTVVQSIQELSDGSSISASESGSDSDVGRRRGFRFRRRRHRDSQSSRNTGDEISSGSSSSSDYRWMRRRTRIDDGNGVEMRTSEDDAYQHFNQDDANPFESDSSSSFNRRGPSSWRWKKSSRSRDPAPDGGGAGFSFRHRSSSKRTDRRRVDLRGAAQELDDEAADDGARRDGAARYRGRRVDVMDDDNDIARMRDLDDLEIDDIGDENEPNIS